MRQKYLLVSIILVISLFFSCQRGGEKEGIPGERLVVSRDLVYILGTIDDRLGDGDEAIFFSSKSYFEEIIGRKENEGLSITWVVPDRQEITKEKLENLTNYFSGKRGPGRAEKGKIELGLEDDIVRGFLEGVRMQIMTLKTFNQRYENIEVKGPVFADSSFPFLLYRNEVSTPMINLILSYGARLAGLLQKGSKIYVFDNDRVLPPKYRYFSLYLKEIVENPDMIGKDLPRKWWLRANGDYLESFFQLDDALDSYQKALEGMPDDPALLYQIGFLMAKRGKEGYLEYLERAYSLDEGFFDGFLEVAIMLGKSKQAGRALTLLEHAKRVKPGDPRPDKIAEGMK